MKPSGQMTLSLTSELEDFVRRQVRDGAYASSSEYVRDLIRERFLAERERVASTERLDAAIAAGIADAEAGRVQGLDEAFNRLRRSLRGAGRA